MVLPRDGVEPSPRQFQWHALPLRYRGCGTGRGLLSQTSTSNAPHGDEKATARPGGHGCRLHDGIEPSTPRSKRDMLTKYTNGAVLRSGPTLHHLRWTAGPVLEFSSGRTPQWMSTAAGYSWEVGERERWCYSSTRADSRLQRWEMFKPTTLRWHDAHPSTWLLLHARKKVLQCTDSCENGGIESAVLCR